MPFDKLVNFGKELSITIDSIIKELNSDQISIEYSPSPNNILTFDLIRNNTKKENGYMILKEGISFNLYSLTEVEVEDLINSIIEKLNNQVETLYEKALVGNL